MATNSIMAALYQERKRIDAAIEALGGEAGTVRRRRRTTTTHKVTRRRVSKAEHARRSQAQKERWAKIKASSKE